MAIYRIKDADGNVTNPGIRADETFMAANFDYYEVVVEPEAPTLTEAEEARMWRDEELQSSDWIVPTSDHPQHAAYITYRAALRNWPSVDSEGEYTNDFPDTKPTLGS